MQYSPCRFMSQTMVSIDMAGENTFESALDAVAETVGEQTTEAFELLGNETRLAILLTLWAAQEPGRPVSDAEDVVVSFSELRERLGRPDSGQFNYHLTKLVGQFVEQSNEGYTLTPAADQILHTVFAGALTDPPSFDGEPIDAGCPQCGAPTVIDYNDGMLTQRCTSCEGIFRGPDLPPGTLQLQYRPPVGLTNRTPQEFFRKGNTRTRHQSISMAESVCPDCFGSVTASLHLCETHDDADGTVCVNCGQRWDTQWIMVCDICKFDIEIPGFAPIFTETGVRAFYYDHGRDHDALYDAGAWDMLFDPIEAVEVTAKDPVELRVTVDLEGDRLTVTLDADATVIEVLASKS